MQSQFVNEDNEVIKTAEPLSYYVMEALKEYSPNTLVIPYGDEARLANIKGLYVKAQTDILKKAMAQSQLVASQVQTQAQSVVQPQVQPQVEVQTAVQSQAVVQPQVQTVTQPQA
jgi:hypothetical protein